MATSPYNLIQQRQSLSEQLKRESQRQAQQTAQGSRQQLSDMVRQQQMNVNMSRQQLGEQGFQTQRAIEQGAAARGLGGSGLQNLSLVQSQLAQGRAVSDVEAQNRGVMTQAMREGRAIDQDLANKLRQADLTFNQQQVDEGQRLQEQIMALYEAGVAGASQAEIQQLAAMLGVDTNMLSDQQRQAIESTGLVDELGGLDLGLGQSGISRFASSLGLVGATVGVGRLFDKDFGYAFDTELANPNYDPIGKTASYNYTIAGQKLGFTNAGDVAYYIKNTVYKDKPYIQNMQVRVNTRTGKVEFVAGGKGYSTYNQAEAALRGT
jgi:hypothetical protein